MPASSAAPGSVSRVVPAGPGCAPYWPWVQLLTALGRADALAVDHRGSPDLIRFRFFEAVAAALRGVAPVLLVLDDLPRSPTATGRSPPHHHRGQWPHTRVLQRRAAGRHRQKRIGLVLQDQNLYPVQPVARRHPRRPGSGCALLAARGAHALTAVIGQPLSGDTRTASETVTSSRQATPRRCST
jgi:hypothetical protein